MYLKFAICFFTFLLSESLVNDRAGVVLGTNAVNYVYAFGLFCTAMGYSLFAKIKEKNYIVVSQGTAFLSLVVLVLSKNAIVTVTAGYFLLIALGYIGGYIHTTLAGYLNTAHFALKIGGSAALAILLQFVMQNGMNRLSIYVLGLGILFLGPVKEAEQKAFLTSEIALSTRLKVAVFSIMMMSFILGFQDSLLTMKNAQGEVLLFSGVRLFYALGLLVAGAISDLNNRLYLPLAASTAMILSILAMALFDSFTLSMSLMYFYSGFYVIYLTLASLELAVIGQDSYRYAGLGRIVRCLSTMLVVFITTLFAKEISSTAYVIFNGLFSIAIILVMALCGFFKLEKPKTMVDNLSLAFEQYHLTAKEQEVLEKLITSEATVQAIADEMGISRRVLQRHIASLYEKMNVETRVGLLMTINNIKQ